MAERYEVIFTSALIDTAFVDRRWKQRRILRNMPAWMIHDTCAGNKHRRHGGAIDDDDGALMETHLRDLADRLTGQLHLTIDELSAATLAMAALHVYEIWGDANLELLKVERERTRSDPVCERYADTGRALAALDDLDAEAVATLMTVLVWADELAGDYCDPRLCDHRSDAESAPALRAAATA